MILCSRRPPCLATLGSGSGGPVVSSLSVFSFGLKISLSEDSLAKASSIEPQAIMIVRLRVAWCTIFIYIIIIKMYPHHDCGSALSDPLKSFHAS
jgi:hypothetical protein